MSHRDRAGWFGWIGLAVVVLAAGEWLRTPGLGLVALLVAGVVLALLPGPRRVPPVVAVLLGLVAAVPLAEGVYHRLAGAGNTVRQARAARAAEVATRRALDATRYRLETLADRAAAIAAASPEDAVHELERILPDHPPEVGLLLTDPAGTPAVWAGRHRLLPVADSAGLRFIATSYYAVLEVRRQRSDGGFAIASTTLWADSLLPLPVASLAGRLADAHRFDTEFRRTGAAAAAVAWPDGEPVLGFLNRLPNPDEALRLRHDQGLGVVAWLLVGLLVWLLVQGPAPAVRYGVLGLAVWLGVRTPLLALLGWTEATTPSTYFSALLGPLSSSAGALMLTGAAGFILAVAFWHRSEGAPWRRWYWIPTILLAAGTPYLIREFGRGITPPTRGVSLTLWWSWHLALLLPAATSLVTAAGLLRRHPGLRPSSRTATLASVFALAAAVVGVLAFTGRPGWPVWYTFLWFPPVLLAAFPAPRRAAIVALALVSGAGASLMTWGAGLAGRTDVAMHDLDGLGRAVDPLVEPLLEELSRSLTGNGPVSNATELYLRWTTSSLARQGYPVRLDLWTADGRPVATARLDALEVPDSVIADVATRAIAVADPLVARVPAYPGTHYVMATRLDDLEVATVTVGPRTALIGTATLGRSLNTGQDREALYRLSLAAGQPGPATAPADRWRREGWALRLWRQVDYPDGAMETHALIPLGRPPWIQIRGGLLILLDVLLLWGLWLVAERAAAVRRTPIAFDTLWRSFRARLAVALALFCIAPAATLGVLAMTQLGAEAARSRDLVLQRTLHDALPEGGWPAGNGVADALRSQRGRVDADLALYRQGRLRTVSDPVVEALGIFPPLLEPSAHHAVHLDGDRTAPSGDAFREARVRAGYAAVVPGRGGRPDVLAAVAPVSDLEFLERRTDVAALLLLATLLGIVAAVVGADRASRMLSRPVTRLRQAAIAFGAGRDPVPAGRQPPEFEPVFDAFGRMATDVKLTQAALEEARKRTAAVLATVTTGVVAVDGAGRVLLANRRAAEALRLAPEPGELLARRLDGVWQPMADALAARLDDPDLDDAELEVDDGERRYLIQFAPMGTGGLVLAINDVTESTRAARILAWGEVASQVAHAIKNPLTPVRLGIQHLQRVRDTRPAELAGAMDTTAARLLAEIDRLDGIARAFSRLAAPEAPGRPLEPVVAGEVVREVEALYDLVPGIRVRLADGAERVVWCRRDELKEVLLNLVDNARNAGASVVTVRAGESYMEISDDGRGIPPEMVPRVFEPRFTTTSSGAGLGLAIVRRLVEGWQATIGLDSAPGRGTTLRIAFTTPADG